jgi:hypothetical protein
MRDRTNFTRVIVLRIWSIGAHQGTLIRPEQSVMGVAALDFGLHEKESADRLIGLSKTKT